MSATRARAERINHTPVGTKKLTKRKANTVVASIRSNKTAKTLLSAFPHYTKFSFCIMVTIAIISADTLPPEGAVHREKPRESLCN